MSRCQQTWNLFLFRTIFISCICNIEYCIPDNHCNAVFNDQTALNSSPIRGIMPAFGGVWKCNATSIPSLLFVMSEILSCPLLITFTLNIVNNPWDVVPELLFVGRESGGGWFVPIPVRRVTNQSNNPPWELSWCYYWPTLERRTTTRSDNELILCQLVANQYTNNKQRH